MYRFERAALREPAPEAFAEPRDVRFQDVDAAGVIFYSRVFEYFHDVYVSFLAQNGSCLPDVLHDKSWAAPIRHAEADYFKPLRFGDRVLVALVSAHVEPSEATLGFQIVRGEQVCAVGQTVHAFVDATSFQRIAIPDALGQAFAKLTRR